MAADHPGTSPDSDVERIGQELSAERRLPPDRPGDAAFPSRADSRLAAANAPSGEKHGLLDESAHDDKGPEADVPEFTPKQLADLKKIESDIRALERV
ncbi:hypothetical protein [Actinoallomurus iriomotensis]|uniref:Uncharacterized protein n=1 Tax=Actinoallomurus iriomotensis TaxID=478107 RepID=A0A9W6RRE3_9ACTN|nr:hypothetical protein [Actinoallomurus iriomotensis]GLY80388.1 hypothetical protein Airi01_086550 [Actinoallomurus iriomotensis]